MDGTERRSSLGAPSPTGTPRTGYYTVVEGEDSNQELMEKKAAKVEEILQEMQAEFKNKKQATTIPQGVRNKILALALGQATAEGRCEELRQQIKELKSQLESAKINASEYPDASLKLNESRLKGQNEILTEQNARLRKQLAEANDPHAAEKILLLQEEVQKLREENAMLKAANSNTPTYAAMAAAAAPATTKMTKLQTNIEKAKTKQSSVLFFKPTNQQNTNEVRTTITKNINPSEDKIKIKQIRTTPNTVIVETESQADAKKILERAATLKDIKCEEPRKSRPLFAIYQVDRTLTDEEFLRALHAINLSDALTKEEFDQEVKLLFKTGPRNKPRVNNIIEVSPRVYHLLTKCERVFINFEALRIKEFIKVSWCSKCCDLGHTAARCTRKAVCHKCANEGHNKEGCQGQAVGCLPCKYRNRQCDKAGGQECPTYKLLFARQVNNTDYTYGN